jgi:DNA-binding GntR family transcriptional regulator
MPVATRTETGYRTKQERVYRVLRESIQRNELEPGERLVIDELARRFEVSAIPVREALQQLQAEGLVVNVPHVGAAVAPISADSVREVFAVMEGLELAAVRAAAERIDARRLDELGELVAQMDAALERASHEDWAELNARFHLAICDAAGMPMLAEMTRRALSRWERLRRHYLRDVLVPRLEQAQREHRELLAGLRARDLAALEDVIRRHNRGAFADYDSHARGRSGAA